MESKNYYRVTYNNKFIKNLIAHTKWEAVDKVYAENIKQDRTKLKATKLN